jgi:hypothetical protein
MAAALNQQCSCNSHQHGLLFMQSACTMLRSLPMLSKAGARHLDTSIAAMSCTAARRCMRAA